MFVIKRDGSKEPVRFEKVSNRIRKMTYGLNQDLVDPVGISQKVIAGIYDGISTQELDILAAETAASMIPKHPDHSILASRIAVSRLHKTTKKKFSDTIQDLYDYIDPVTKQPAGMIGDSTYAVVMQHKNKLDSAVLHERDFDFEYFGFKTLEKSYLLKMNGEASETPQHMYMRVAVGIWGDDIKNVIKTYELLSSHMMTHATPTLFNSGTRRPQLSSCFLLMMDDDSIPGIYKTLSDVAVISQNAGGIGLAIHNVRSTGSYIKGTNGTSNGIIPMLRVFNETARYVDQGGGRRKGSFAIYMEPWHADIEDFLELRKNTGKEERRARDLFLALWTPDLFMKRVKENGDWSLFSPSDVNGLWELYGEEFDRAYELAESEGKARKTMKARDLWGKILESQIETGTPYILYKDSANKKSNQKNIGTIKSSNLCTEIMEVTSRDEQAVCNLASIPVNKFLKSTDARTTKIIRGKCEVDHEELYKVAYQTTLNLNKVIDVNYYPTEETKKSNMRHRPIGIGIQGLADLYAIMGIGFTSEEARKINSDIFETIYFASCTASKDLSKANGPYETFSGSPISQGEFQFNLWGFKDEDLSGRWDWSKLRKEVMKSGVRNSLLLAPMPTASTAQIMGNNEAFEPFTSNIYTRRTLSGEFVVVNKHLVKDLINLGLWGEDTKNLIILNKGSVQNVPGIPDDIKEVYKTVWEIKQKDLLEMSADRGRFICQSQSMNLFIEGVNAAKLTTAHFYSWELGLKTGMYYLRTKSAADALSGLGVDLSKYKDQKKEELKSPIVEQVQQYEEAKREVTGLPEELTRNSQELADLAAKLTSDIVCSLDSGPDECVSCGS
jgi:ribonucleoside-diphosphate reductase alpha chain